MSIIWVIKVHSKKLPKDITSYSSLGIEQAGVLKSRASGLFL